LKAEKEADIVAKYLQSWIGKRMQRWMFDLFQFHDARCLRQQGATSSATLYADVSGMFEFALRSFCAKNVWAWI
jgi:hypothetical protein